LSHGTIHLEAPLGFHSPFLRRRNHVSD
jgi:hypothetical protein